MGGVKKLLTTVPVRKPNKQDFIRVHPDPDFRLCGVAIIELKEDRENYLVVPSYAQQLDPQLFNLCNLFLGINRQKVVFLWPVKLPEPGGRISGWHTSGLEGAEKAMAQWIRVVANMNLGAYEFFVAENSLSEPEWPTLSLRELLQIGFKGRVMGAKWLRLRTCCYADAATLGRPPPLKSSPLVALPKENPETLPPAPGFSVQLPLWR
jgi:hypothetical protein